MQKRGLNEKQLSFSLSNNCRSRKRERKRERERKKREGKKIIQEQKDVGVHEAKRERA